MCLGCVLVAGRGFCSSGTTPELGVGPALCEGGRRGYLSGRRWDEFAFLGDEYRIFGGASEHVPRDADVAFGGELLEGAH